MRKKADTTTDKIKYRTFKRVLLTIFSLMVVAGVSIFSYLQIVNYEESVIDIYATQQDSYVQLVLDQINLVDDRTSLEIVSEILGTLDSSSNRYWTLTENQSLVFVKDVLETNRYKGFTAETYYASDEARNFLSNLNVNQVVHSLIYVGGKEYIASGVAFDYNNEVYQICLLTNPDNVLEHNVYMSAKINLCLAVISVVAIYIVTVFYLMLSIEKKEREADRIEQDSEALRIKIEKMNAKLQRQRLFDTEYSVFDSSILPMLMEKAAERKIAPVTTAILIWSDEKSKEQFLQDAQFMLDEKVFKFQDKENKQLTLVALQCSLQSLMTALKPLLRNGIYMQKMTSTLDDSTTGNSN